MKQLSSPLQQYWPTVVERLPAAISESSLSVQAKSVLTFSDFVRDSIIAHPEWLAELESTPPLADEWQHYADWLQQTLADVSDENTLMRELRLFRRRIMVRIAWAQTLSLVTEESILQQLSHLAETLIVAARDWLYAACCREWGTPCNPEGVAQPLLILGMGKLGGGELNFSSDIDLIFAWPEHGSTQGGRRELDNAQFFTRLGQRLIKVLDQPTMDGFVYRVDMRLRPFGDSGPLVLSFSALEDYYQEQGRDWERYAMVKARIMGDADGTYVSELRAMLRPFVFRRYIDFSVIQSLRNMKGMIAREVRRRGLKDNIKLGAGGIREIEFIVQVFQLIRGGREPSLQSSSLRKSAIRDSTRRPSAPASFSRERRAVPSLLVQYPPSVEPDRRISAPVDITRTPATARSAPVKCSAAACLRTSHPSSARCGMRLSSDRSTAGSAPLPLRKWRW